jgi:hypothetical protein
MGGAQSRSGALADVRMIMKATVITEMIMATILLLLYYYYYYLMGCHNNHRPFTEA